MPQGPVEVRLKKNRSHFELVLGRVGTCNIGKLEIAPHGPILIVELAPVDGWIRRAALHRIPRSDFIFAVRLRLYAWIYTAWRTLTQGSMVASKLAVEGILGWCSGCLFLSESFLHRTFSEVGEEYMVVGRGVYLLNTCMRELEMTLPVPGRNQCM